MFGRLMHWYTTYICIYTCIYAFWGLLPPNVILPAAKFTLRPSLAFSYIGSALHGTRAAAVSQTLWRGTSLQGMELRNFRRGRHLYSVGRPSRWVSAHVLVLKTVVTVSAGILAFLSTGTFSLTWFIMAALRSRCGHY